MLVLCHALLKFDHSDHIIFARGRRPERGVAGVERPEHLQGPIQGHLVLLLGKNGNHIQSQHGTKGSCCSF